MRNRQPRMGIGFLWAIMFALGVVIGSDEGRNLLNSCERTSPTCELVAVPVWKN